MWALSRFLAQKYHISRWLVFVSSLIAGCALFIGLTFVYPGGLLGLANRLPGVPSGVSRVDLFRGALDLIQEYPFTGGGLGAFAGIFGYSHNIYLDIALEQGISGLFLFLFVYAGCLWMIIYKEGDTSVLDNCGLLKGALIGSLFVVLIHGLIDDAIYGNRGTSLIFLLPGMVVFFSRTSQGVEAITDKNPSVDKHIDQIPGKSRTRQKHILLVLGLLFLGAAFLSWHRQFRASWYANLGSIIMAQSEMVKFPSDSWEDLYWTEYPNQVDSLFEKALRIDASNQTANYRQGLIALARKEFPEAVIFLEAALLGDSAHRGVRKALGYAYTWTGDFDAALNLLKDIPESSIEMGSYTWWWKLKGRNDLANNAGKMKNLLASCNLMNGIWTCHD
jgi:hypothetical protein